jgi:Ni/Co efflux regulator RcnB
MNRLLAVLVAAAFAAGSMAALAQGTAPAPKQDAMKASTDKDKDKYKECMKKDASGKEMMDQACKDKMDKAGMAKGGTTTAPTAPAGSMSKDAPKGK